MDIRGQREGIHACIQCKRPIREEEEEEEGPQTLVSSVVEVIVPSLKSEL